MSSNPADAAFERVRAAGAEVVQKPIDQPCGVRDPSGNPVRFSGPIRG